MTTEAETKLGWHFTANTLRNGSPIPGTGEWLRHDRKIIPCISGLHMSEHPWDALAYAPGPILHRVELRGDLAPHGEPVNKWVGRERRIIASKEATDMLRRFAKDQALSVADKWDMPDVVREYLASVSEDLRDAALNAARFSAQSLARPGAWSAARSAAWSATLDEVWDAARDAARSVALDAARSAAWDAAWDVARDAAWDAARDAARSVARSVALDAARSATWDAAWDTAWDTAWDAARDAARSVALDPARSAARSAARDAAKTEFADRVKELFQENAE